MPSRFVRIHRTFLPAVLLVLPALIAGCRASDNADASAPIRVTTLAIAEQRVPVVFEAVGRTEGAKEVEVRARVSGIIERREYTEGKFVRAGARLFQIERAPFEIALAQARANAEQAAANAEQAEREVDRLDGLIANGAVSKRQAEEAHTTHRTAPAT